MDFAQKLFQKVAQLYTRARQRTDARERPERVELETVRTRLELLSALLAGERLELHGVDAAGGYVGTDLLLPRYMDVQPDVHRNEQSYIYRLAFTVAARDLGFAISPGDDDPTRRQLMTWLAVEPIRRALEQDYPRAVEMRRALEPACLAARPRVEQPTRAEDMLELLCQLRLGGEPPASLAPELDAWLQHACTVCPESVSVLWRETNALYDRLHRLLRPGGGPRPAPVALWGELQAQPQPVAEAADDDVPDEDDTLPEDRNVLDLERTVRLQRKPKPAERDRPLFHMFEKVETVEEHEGESGTPDDNGDVRELEDALRELNLGSVVRSMEQPRNLIRADVITDPEGFVTEGRAAGAASHTYQYAEWNHKRGTYHDDWCTLVERRIVGGPAATDNRQKARRLVSQHHQQIEAIRVSLLQALFRRMLRGRQLDGPEIDVEAMVERHADLHAGTTPPERLYSSPRRRPRDVAVLVLIDTSMSTDAWLEGRRVLDVEIESLLTLAEAFEGYVEREIAVACFQSRTRRDCRFGLIKDFGAPWQHVRETAPALKPDGYTRIGPAIRHATHLLEQQRARHKLLLVVSDGKPTDYDRYEGRYGIEDVRKAVAEATQRQITCFGLAIEKEAKHRLGRMLGPGRYRILPRVSSLADAMADVLTKTVS